MKKKNTFEPFTGIISYSWFIHTITLVCTSKLQNGGLTALLPTRESVEVHQLGDRIF